ncbi:MAG: hypothetical protein NTV39_00990 [Candidatus Saccharibacteria bacterium]|nr:hypothetical protein [Candidatus Saccharibacteria bacterium]
MKKNKFNALTLRSLLLVCVILLIIVIVGGFIFASNWISNSATDTKTKSYTTVSGNLSNSEINNLQNDINSHRSSSIKAIALIGSDKNFEKIMRQDLNKYAADTGISITNFAISQKPSFMTTDAPVTGVESQYITISLGGSIPFAKFYEFIRGIESNTPKMKITGISMDSASGQNGLVSVKPMIIEVYTE